MHFQLSSAGNEAIKERRCSVVEVAVSLVGHAESNCDTKTAWHRFCHRRHSPATTAYMLFFFAGTCPSPRTFSTIFRPQLGGDAVAEFLVEVIEFEFH